MYGGTALGVFYLAVLGLWGQLLFQEVCYRRAESRAAHKRRCRRELDLKCKVRPACRTLPRSVCGGGNETLHVAWYVCS